MNKFAWNFCMVILLFLPAVSCIKEDPSDCPSQVLVKLTVKDTNYFNIALFPALTPEDETQPFSHFIGSLYYILTETTAGQPVKESGVWPMQGTGPVEFIAFDGLPAGKYDLSVWGNLTSAVPAGTLHPERQEYTDLYMGHITFETTSGTLVPTVELERTKSKLVIFCLNFPDRVAQIEQKIGPVYQSVDTGFTYSGITSVQKKSVFKEINETFIAPTPVGGTTKLNLNFYAAPGDTDAFLTVPEMNVVIRRNELSVMAVNYNSAEGKWEVWTYLQGEWNMFHRMDID